MEAGCIVPVLPGELHAIDGAPDGPMEYENIIFSLSILDSTETDDWCRHHVIRITHLPLCFIGCVEADRFDVRHDRLVWIPLLQPAEQRGAQSFGTLIFTDSQIE